MNDIKGAKGYYVSEQDAYDFDNQVRRLGWPCSSYKGIGGGWPNVMQVMDTNGQVVVVRAKKP